MAQFTSANSDRQAQEPSFQHRGMFIPGDVMQLVNDGVLTPIQALLFSYIDSMVKIKGEGCWASNCYLARLIQRTVRHTQRIIQKGIRLGLLRVVGTRQVSTTKQFEERRILETVWSRVVVNKHTDPMTSVTPHPMTSMTPNIDTQKKSKNVARLQAASPPCTVTTEFDFHLSADGTLTPLTSPGKKESGVLPIKDWKQQDAINQSQQLPPPTPQTLGYADRLGEAVQRAGKTRYWNKAKSAQWFSRLLRKLDHNSCRLEEVLDWYCSRGMKGDYSVQAWSGRTFYEKFDKLEAAKRRADSRSPQLTITPEAHRVADRLLAYHEWPDKQAVLDAVQSALNVLNDLNSRMNRFRMAKADSHRLVKLARYMMTGPIFHDPAHYTELWFRDIRKWMGRTGHSGSLLKMGINLENERFVAACRQEAARYSSAGMWDELMEAIR